MTIAHPAEPTPRKPLRLWPGVVLAIVLALFRYGIPLVASDAELFSFPLALIALFGGLLAAVAVVVWWLFFSRAPWSERVGALVLMVAALFATSRVVDKSIAEGMMGMTLFIYSIPLLSLALAVWAVATRRLPDGARRASLVAAIVLACAPWPLLRTAGVIGSGAEWHWRWTPTPEDRLLAQGRDEPIAAAPIEKAPPVTGAAPAETPKDALAAKGDNEAPAVAAAPPAAKTEPAVPSTTEKAADWPGFRGPERDGIVRGVRINPDWSTSPPVEMWRRPIGPGWSSFAVRGDLLYTQEQRGDDEIVAAYKVSTGEPVWKHRDAVRFWESNGGAGPRATPTLHRDRVYSFGATGVLNALDAGNGAVVWSRNAASDTSTQVPDWGFASSPQVFDDVVIVAVSGTLIGYDLASGRPRWTGPVRGGSYSSPHRSTIDGVVQIVLLTGTGAISVAPTNGMVLWEHEWPGSAIVQPALTADGEVLIGMAGAGTRRLAVTHKAGGWRVDERWTSTGLKPYFNDFVVHKGHAFGFDGSILACIDLEDGRRKWKGGRYGNGQLVLLPDQDVLVVLSEEGELALVGATTEKFAELARFPALNAKTWNHPVLVGDVLLVRNGEEMAAFRLSLVPTVRTD